MGCLDAYSSVCGTHIVVEGVISTDLAMTVTIACFALFDSSSSESPGFSISFKGSQTIIAMGTFSGCVVLWFGV